MNEQAKALRPIREIAHFLIPMSDGCRLAARMWLPEDAEINPVPAVLEYIPYRKRDGTAPRDETMHPDVAARGYACLRVDMRGNGDSEGLMLDEYLPQELQDGIEVVEWIARQPWCSGEVGIVGISWGGFNGLQIAALRPKPLKAIITVCSTDDRYADDIHYRGGCLLNDNLSWSATMMAYSSRPPDPTLVGEGWRGMWLERLENMPFLAANWLEHQRRDAFWQHGSVCEDNSAIEAAVFAVGGWADPYTNAIPRMLGGLTAPTRGLIGPWGHKYPHIGLPGPAMNFREEMVRWWDRWLGGRSERDIPNLRAFILDGPDRGDGPDDRQGFWVSESQWPSPNVVPHRLFMTTDKRLAAAPSSAGELSVMSPVTTGLAGGRFYPKLGRADLAVDQRPDDAMSLVFDGAPLTMALELLGAPVVELSVSADKPQANIAVRLCHVSPNGASHRICMGVLNLAHRDSHAVPKPLEPGQVYRVQVRLDDIGYRIPAGHRLRVAISTAYWPMIWPSAENATLTVTAGQSWLQLPVRQAGSEDDLNIPATEPTPVAGVTFLREASSKRRISYDPISRETAVDVFDDAGLKRFVEHGLEAGAAGRETYLIRADDPLSATARTHWTTEMGRGDWRVRTESTSTMRADATSFYLEAELVAVENEQEVFRNRWKRTIARDLV